MKTTVNELAYRYAEIYRCPATNENEYCKHDIISAYNKGYAQCQEDMYEFGKLVLDTFHSEGKTHSGKDRLARVKFDEWFKQLNKQD